MERLTVPDEPIEGGMRRAIIDTRAVRGEAMKIYWALKKYEDTGLTPQEIIDGKMLTGWIPVEGKLPEDVKTVSGEKAIENIVTNKKKETLKINSCKNITIDVAGCEEITVNVNDSRNFDINIVDCKNYSIHTGENEDKACQEHLG